MPPRNKQARYYLALLAISFITLMTSSELSNRVWGGVFGIAAVLIIGITFFHLFTTLRCSSYLTGLLFFAVCFLVFARSLDFTEELPFLDHFPLLGKNSSLNAPFTNLSAIAGLILFIVVLILAVVDLGTAHQRVAGEIALRSEAETALRAHRAQLEDKVRARIEQIHNAQEKLHAHIGFAALGGMIQTLSARLQEPLSELHHALDTIQNALETNNVAPVAMEIARCDGNILRCDRVIEELHDFSRAQVLSKRTTPIDRWLLGLLDHMVFPEHVQVIHTLEAGVSLALDPDRMECALAHLIQNSLNALHTTDPSKAMLYLRSEVHGDFCRIAVEDSGTGMPPDTLQQVRAPLFNMTDTSGLGVIIARETIRNHGGTIHFDSAPDRGTRACIELPMAP